MCSSDLQYNCNLNDEEVAGAVKKILDEKVTENEPKHHRKAVIKGITVYESFRSEGSELWDCLLQSMGKH